MYETDSILSTLNVPHYYGDIVRRYFIAGALIMFGTLAFFSRDLPFPVPVSLAAIALVVLAAGLTSPRHRSSAILNAIISISAVIIFGYFGVIAYNTYSVSSALFWINDGLGIMFLIALYYAAKTIRGWRRSIV